MKAKYDILKLISLYKMNIEKKENLMKLIECMQPVINKYARKLYEGESEDMCQELTLSLIEAVNKIETYNNEGKVINFLVNAVRNRFYELYRKNKILKKEEMHEIDILENMCDCNNQLYADIEFKVDLGKSIHCNSRIQRNIAYYVLCENISDTEIARNLHISRQYVNRCKKQIFKLYTKN